MTVEQVTTGTAPFFHHAQTAQQPQQPLQNTTRYLCAAVYLDRDIGDRVISEFLDDENRAVVPSYGFDVEPVLLHALRARRYRLVRDLVLGGIWLGALIFLQFLAIGYFFVLLILAGVFSAISWRRLTWGWRLVAGWMIFGLLAWVVTTVAFLVAGEQVVEDSGFSTYEQEQSKGVLELLQTDLAIPSLFILTLALSLTVIGHMAAVYGVLARDLAPGATGPGPRTYSGRAVQVLARIRSAQRGNVTLHSGTNPFIGAGDLTSPWARAWSIVLELDRPAGDPVNLSKGGGDEPPRVDPMIMHLRVRDRLHAMRDELPPGEQTADPLPLNERITALLTGMHIAGRGESVRRTRPVDPANSITMPPHPLIDPASGCPFSMATPDAIESLIRHPQSHIRCFQRVTVGAHGQAAIGRDGRVVAPAEEQDISLTAFMYLAVEGRMLYGHFAATVLTPVRREFRVVDLLPAWGTGTQVLRAFTHGRRGLLRAMALPGVRTATTCWSMLRSLIAATVAQTSAQRMVHDYGARISVRELCAADDFDTYIQEMDADKYTRLIEWRVNEALLDYLGDECGLDVSAYRAQAGVIMNEGVIMTGGTVNGQVGAGRRVDQRQQGGARRINP